MKVTLLQACRISLLTTFLAASFPEAGLAATTGAHLWGEGNGYVFRLSSTPLAPSRGG
jgi:hypothetical protein